MDPTPPDGAIDVERRVCPNCRLYFDVGADLDTVFCSDACRRRHERGELIADGGRVEDGGAVEHKIPDGWRRETVLAGMDTVGYEDGADISGGYKCESCSHFIPINAIDEATCPGCGSSGLIGTIVAGRQEFTVLFPEDHFDEEVSKYVV